MIYNLRGILQLCHLSQEQVHVHHKSTITMQPAMVKSERKSRSKRQKENYDAFATYVDSKKHYVLYPGNDEENNHKNEVRSWYVLRRHTLKEQNINTTNPISTNSEGGMKITKITSTHSSLLSTTTMQPTIVKSERKTRSKRQNENYELAADVDNKKHYVLYPENDEENNHENAVKSTRVLRRHTLKEHNINPSNSILINSESAVKKSKNTRVSKKMVEEFESDAIPETEVKSKAKKNKKKKNIVNNVLENNDEIIKNTASNIKKKSKKKKNTKKSSSDGISEMPKDSTLNGSTETFYSAAGSPIIEKINGFDKEISEPETERNNLTKILPTSNITLPQILPRKKRSKLVKYNDNECGIYTDKSSKVLIELKSNVNDACNINNTSDYTNNFNDSCKDTFNSTFEEPNLNNTVLAVNKTNVEILISGSKSLSSGNSINRSNSKHSLDRTYEKCESSPNKTHDLTINNENKANSTFDKDQKTPSEASNIVNVTFDKSNVSLVSISSKDSRIDNLASPISIDSSINVSNISKTQEMIVKQTSLERENTYTKESTQEIEGLGQFELNTPESSDQRASLSQSSKRYKSLPGSTPYNGAKNSGKGKKVLNLTHSVEKPSQTPLLTEKTTKVMFCSPVDHPTATSQIKRRVIKSSLKGSNKSFLINDNLSETKRPGTRKRSLTQNDADDRQRKVVRLGDELQQSVNRLSRPRTVSAAATLSEPLTPSENTKPEGKPTRTKLPNFAALHRKIFKKMESLNECQERKAKRARQLLTPTGAHNLIERISPKEKVPDSPKAVPKEGRRPATPYKPKLPTLESLNPGYTRFGFKLNCAVNPFIAPPKQADTETKNMESGLSRQASMPSLAGMTSMKRLAAAKQSVMKEKSFTGKMDAMRKEFRTVIKGVRTNRRFDLQMQMRNINC